MATRNITLSMPEEVIRRAKVLAAERDTSVSALVAQALTELTGPADDYDDTWRREELLMDVGLGMQVGEVTWSREDLHSR